MAPPDGPNLEGLAGLEVIDRLQVGPVEVRPNEVRTPYRVCVGEKIDEAVLTYRYEEPVFHPGESGDLNLASLIGAQVALNYGLFCKEINFQGHFDETDQKFLSQMLANTAREIYVKKLLEPNPFLVPGAIGSLPTEKPKSFVRARVTFGDSNEPAASAGWTTSTDRYAILSSGGKDSLLTFGLLRELGCETHPVFLNEAGRHWFTAVNAHREFRRTVPNTSRVWTNSDRMFNWMLRQLPFIRPDFQRLRSDEYPIRLWTVAVFLFGALPILRQRGIGRLLIGDEYDTTVRASYQGIAHYDGLYDQSRFFDRAMSRFFASKQWGVTQHSVLRPMSEYLIQTTLANRYPDLLKLQVSCHAAHEKDGLMRPCGRCEKCRRIVGMLLAAGVDPGLCGYQLEQVEAIRIDLVEKGVHQERVAARHLGFVLARQGLITEPRIGKVRGQPQPEAVNLRFHDEKSPVDEVPLSIRRRLFEIFLSHAEGAIHRQGMQWEEFDVLADPAINRPYSLDETGPRKRPASGQPAASSGDAPFEWAELSWPQAKQCLESVDIALLPVGAIEQHGPHLPLDTDAFDAEHLAREIARACSAPKPLVLPLIPYGVSYHHDDFPGTVSVSNDGLARFVYDVGMSVARNGVTKLIIINGHGGNSATLHHAAQMINRDARIFTCVDTGESSDPDIYSLAESKNDVHAGEIETSTSLATRPHLVDMKKAKAFVPEFSTRYLDFTSKYSVGWYARTAQISPTGVFGDPTKATAEKGRTFWESSIRHLVTLVEHLKELSLAEIYQQHI
jgi:creatinine amidohydrolase/Fe(II)-dependent formamide hydrolase-like protein